MTNVATANSADFTSQDDGTQMMLAASEASDQQLAAFDSSNRPTVTVSISNQLQPKLAGVSEHIRDSLETTLLERAIEDWCALQTSLVQSFGELNTVGPQRFPLENFLRDALESVSAALRSHSMANVASADDSVAQVSLGLNPQATENLSSPRMMMKLLQIIEKVYGITLEEANQRKVYVAKIESIERDKAQLQKKLLTVPADTVENRAIRSALELDILRMDPQVVAVQGQINKLDRRVSDIAIATGRILNVHYQPEKLAETFEGFIQAVRDVPTVASKVSPKELSKLSGNPSLSFTIELPKVEKVEAIQSETPVVRPPVAAKKASVHPSRRSEAPAARALPYTFASRERDLLPNGARSLGIVRLPSGKSVQIITGKLKALEQVVAGLRPGTPFAAYVPSASDIGTAVSKADLEKDIVASGIVKYIENNRDLYAGRYEKLTGTQLPAQSRGVLETYESGGPIFFLNDFPVGMFDFDGTPLPEENLVEFLALLYRD